MYKKLLLLYGLPGCGKTTLCKFMQDRYNFYYINLAKDENWNKLSMIEIFCNIYNKNNLHNIYCTEGVFYNIKSRNNFILKIKRYYENLKIYTIYLNLHPNILSTRRHRSINDYIIMKNNYNIDYKYTNFMILNVDSNINLYIVSHIIINFLN